jgi:hypothetical protein
MASYLMKNGEVLCDLIPSDIHRLPAKQEDGWHDCTVVTDKRVVLNPRDAFEILTPGSPCLPFMIYRSRIGVEGWDVVGQVLF